MDKQKINTHYKGNCRNSILNIDNIFEKKLSIVYHEQATFERLSKIIFKTNKTLEDLQYIAFYLSQLEELKNFIKNDKINIIELLTEIAFSLKFEFYKNNKILFKYGKYLTLKKVKREKNFILF